MAALTIAVLALYGLAAPPSPPTAFPVEPLVRVEAVRRASDDALVVADDHGVHVLERGAAGPRPVLPYADVDVLAARGSADALELVATGRFYGPLWRRGAQRGLIERPADIDIDGLALAGDGSVHALDREHDVVWVWPSPEAEPRVLRGTALAAMFVDGDGRVWLVDERGALLVEDEGRLVVRAEPVLTDERGWVHHVWWSPATQRVWIVASTPEVVVRALDGTVEERHPLPGVSERVDGADGPHGVVLAIATIDDELLVVGDGRVFEAKAELGGTFRDTGLVLDLPDRAVYLVARDRLRRVSIADAFEPRDRRDRPAGSVRGRPARRPGPDPFWWPWIATPMGPRWDLAPRERAHYRLDVELGTLAVMRRRTEGLAVLPFVGYGLDRGRSTDHLFLGGVGLGWHETNNSIGGALVRSRVVVGGNADRTVTGVRTGVMGVLLYGVLTVEVSHQVLWAGAAPLHSVGLSMGVNLGTLVVAAVVVGIGKAIAKAF